MKYAIDRIENDIAVLENINTKEIVEVNINLLPKNIKESDILLKNKDKYLLDEKNTKKRKESIRNRFNKLKKN